MFFSRLFKLFRPADRRSPPRGEVGPIRSVRAEATVAPAPSPFLPLATLLDDNGGRAGTAPSPAATASAGPRFSRSVHGLIPAQQDNRVRPVLHDGFTPTQPIRHALFLAGRAKELERAIEAIEYQNAHLVIFGERGRGKTSFANVLVQLAASAGYGVVQHACHSEASFDHLFSAIIGKVRSRYLRRAAERFGAGGLTADPSSLGQHSHLGASEVTEILSGITTGRLIIVIDEFDRIRSETIKNEFVELLKNLSDLGARVTFVIVGVAQTLTELMALHLSIQRNLVTIHLPLLNDRDIEALIRRGAEAARVEFLPEACELVVQFAKRSPHFAQLLCHHGVRISMRRGSTRVERRHIIEGLLTIVEEAKFVHDDAYRRALGGDDAAMADLLFATAQCRTDDVGQFTAASVAEVCRAISANGADDPAAALQRLTLPEGGEMLKCLPDVAESRYSFIDPTMRFYVLLRQASARGLI